MPNIAIDARFVLRHQRGMPLYVYTICRFLPKEMPDTHFYLLINSQFEHNCSALEYNERLEQLRLFSNVTIVDIKSEDEISWELLKLRSWLKANKPDLLHMPTNRVCFFSGIKQLSTFHDCMEWKYLKKIHPIPRDASIKLKLYFLRKRLYAWSIYKFGLRHVDRVLTISRSAQNALIEHFSFIQKKISYVYHGIPNNYSNNTDNNRPESRKGVLMLGGDSYQKNPENAIKAWARLPEEVRKNHPLTIAGFTSQANSPITKTIDTLKLNSQVNIKSWIEEEELIKLFQSSKALLFASREEGFGFPLVQAFACGTPTVTSTADVLAEISSNAALQAPADSPNELANHLLSLLENDELWLEMNSNALARSNEFDWKKTARHIKNEYEQLLK